MVVTAYVGSVLIHLPTPHDHFSPRTGSAVMTVIDGFAGHSRTRSSVLVARGTYPDRYASADVIEYDAGAWVSGIRSRLDGLSARLGTGRPFGARAYESAMGALPPEPHTLVLHNAPYTARLAPRSSAPVIHAHNEILRGSSPAVARAVAGRRGWWP